MKLLFLFVFATGLFAENNLKLNLNLGSGINRIWQTVSTTIIETSPANWYSSLSENYAAILPAELMPPAGGITAPLETLATLLPKISAARSDTAIEFLALGALEVPVSRLLASLTATPYFHAEDVLAVNEKNAEMNYLDALVSMQAFTWGGAGGTMFAGPTRCNRSDPRIRSTLLHQYLITFENVSISDIAAGQPMSIADLFGNMRTHYQFVKWYIDNKSTDPDEINHYTKLLRDAKQRCEKITGMGDPTVPLITSFSYEDVDTCVPL